MKNLYTTGILTKYIIIKAIKSIAYLILCNKDGLKDKITIN